MNFKRKKKKERVADTWYLEGLYKRFARFKSGKFRKPKAAEHD